MVCNCKLWKKSIKLTSVWDLGVLGVEGLLV